MLACTVPAWPYKSSHWLPFPSDISFSLTHPGGAEPSDGGTQQTGQPPHPGKTRPNASMGYELAWMQLLLGHPASRDEGEVLLAPQQIRNQNRPFQKQTTTKFPASPSFPFCAFKASCIRCRLTTARAFLVSFLGIGEVTAFELAPFGACTAGKAVTKTRRRLARERKRCVSSSSEYGSRKR